MDWRRAPIQRQTQNLKLKLRLRLNQMLKQTLTPSTTEAVITLGVKMVVRGITLGGKMVVKGITLEGKTVGRGITLEDRVHILRSLGCQVEMEEGCHLPMLPYNPAGLATSSPWSQADQGTVLKTQVLDVLVVSRTLDSRDQPSQDHWNGPIS